jgi:toxin YoeB
MKRIAFLPTAFEDFSQWAIEDKRIYARSVKLIKDTLRDPFRGTWQTGTPET